MLGPIVSVPLVARIRVRVLQHGKPASDTTTVPLPPSVWLPPVNTSSEPPLAP
jgi:hypothetical protein